MPWNIRLIEEERRRFIRRALEKTSSVAHICREFGISRKTGFKWLGRFRRDGQRGLLDRSRRPKTSPDQTDGRWQKAIWNLRRKRSHWGAKKILAKLQEQSPRAELPNVRTIHRWLKRQGLVPRRAVRSRRGPKIYRHDLTAARRSNDVWTIDFKGWFKTLDGTRIDPLTVRDLYSRYILGVVLLHHQHDVSVRKQMHLLFKKYGLPKVIRVDHGSPFSGVGALDLSRLSVWWLRLGIRVEFTRRACPQDNGAHEQMHRVYKAEVASPPAANRALQQRRTVKWMREYNHLRPHEALGQKPPALFYRLSRKSYPSVLPDLKYRRPLLTRRVTSKGYIWWCGRRRMVGRAFARQQLGIKTISNGVHQVYLEKQLIGSLLDQDPAGMRPARWTTQPESA